MANCALEVLSSKAVGVGLFLITLRRQDEESDGPEGGTMGSKDGLENRILGVYVVASSNEFSVETKLENLFFEL